MSRIYECQSCGCYTVNPDNRDEDEEYEPCCDSVSWIRVRFHNSYRAKKNWKMIKYYIKVFFEYYNAKIRIKYIPDGEGYLACKRRFESSLQTHNKVAKIQ